MRFDTFDEVASWYARTKPMISKHHTVQDDVRPIGNRSRKWERIKKVSDTCYALLDGCYGRTMWIKGDGEQQYENLMAPIMWTREVDGDYVRIRNHAGSSSSISRYQFLSWHLPSTLRFNYSNGKHWVELRCGAAPEKFPLPKCGVKYNYHKQELLSDDEVFLKFRANPDGTFTRVGELLRVKTRVVDKERKKQWKERIEAFYTYAGALAPLLDTQWHARQVYANEIMQYCRSMPGIDTPNWIARIEHVPCELIRDVLTDEEHPMRPAVAALLVSRIDGKREVSTAEDLRSIRATYNRAINNMLDLYTFEEK